MTKAELWGGPMDGRQIEVPNHEPVLRVPVAQADLHLTGPLVARYVRVDRMDGRVGYRYQGQEQL